MMPIVDPYEVELLEAYERGALRSIATRTELSKFRAAARATAVKDKRMNIRLSAGDLQDIQVKALEQGLPYQALIASVLHKHATGRLAERKAPPTKPVADASPGGLPSAAADSIAYP